MKNNGQSKASFLGIYVFYVWIRLIVIWIVFGGLGIFLLKINQFWAGLISFACGLMFSLFNNFLKD